MKDHLFISYATEDWVLADWLALKLASEGYTIWYDRLKMLGGESYPRDITKGIKDQTFRVIALLSKNSILKPNPVKERTLALNIAKERGLNDFLIPLNVDGLKATDLDFMTSDLVYISFNKSWYEGFSQLLKKLNDIKTPTNPNMGLNAINKWALSEDQPTEKQETQWSNLLPILKFPSILRRYRVIPEINVEAVEPDWLAYRESESTFLAFSPPINGPYDWMSEVDSFDFQKTSAIPFKELRQAITMILKKGLMLLCLRKGLAYDDGSKRLYFPPTLLSNNRLPFIRYDGKKVHIQVVGERKFRIKNQGRLMTEVSRYHLSPDFRYLSDTIGDPFVRLQVGVFWTTPEGIPLTSSTNNRRRKKLCKNWWNYEWLSRMMAIIQWLGDGQDAITLLDTPSGELKIGFKPVIFKTQFGIDEASLNPITPDDDESVIEDSEESDDDAEPNI